MPAFALCFQCNDGSLVLPLGFAFLKTMPDGSCARVRAEDADLFPSVADAVSFASSYPLADATRAATAPVWDPVWSAAISRGSITMTPLAVQTTSDLTDGVVAFHVLFSNGWLSRYDAKRAVDRSMAMPEHLSWAISADPSEADSFHSETEAANRVALCFQNSPAQSVSYHIVESKRSFTSIRPVSSPEETVASKTLAASCENRAIESSATTALYSFLNTPSP